MERSEIRGRRLVHSPDCASLHPGYEVSPVNARSASDEAIHSSFAALWIASLRSQ